MSAFMKNGMWSDFKSDVHGSPLALGVIVAFLASLVFTLVMAGVYTWSTLSETTLPYSAYTINALSALIGALLAARAAGERGWYYGGVSALLFSAVLAIIGSLVDFSAAFQLETIVRIAIIGLIGSFGGVIGVNFSRGRAR